MVTVNGNQNDNSYNNAGAAYVFVRNGNVWSQQAYLKASNTGVDDKFGTWVAVSGDTVVVGAPTESSNATGVNGNQGNNNAQWSGAVYVFVRSGTNWSQQAYLKASNTEVDDRFGSSVAVSGDTVAVGARGEDSNATGVNGNQNDNSTIESGAAYVFTGLDRRRTLDITQSPGNVRIFWPLPANGFVLESTATLTETPVPWIPVPFPYETNASHISITVPVPASNTFYRLRQP